MKKQKQEQQPYHIFPDSIMRQLPGYISEEAPAVAFIYGSAVLI